MILKQLDYDWRYFFKTYLKFSKPTSKVIEIGASELSKTDNLGKHCQSLTGIELYKNRLPKNHKNITYLQADWQSLTKKLPKKSFDILISSHTIEHIQNDLEAINQSYMVLKPGGVALLLTPNRQRLIRAVFEIFSGPRKFPQWEHVREYTESDLINLLSQSHFSKYEINPLIFGIHAYLAIFTYKVPKIFRKYANYWEIILYK